MILTRGHCGRQWPAGSDQRRGAELPPVTNEPSLRQLSLRLKGHNFRLFQYVAEK